MFKFFKRKKKPTELERPSRTEEGRSAEAPQPAQDDSALELGQTAREELGAPYDAHNQVASIEAPPDEAAVQAEEPQGSAGEHVQAEAKAQADETIVEQAAADQARAAGGEPLLTPQPEAPATLDVSPDADDSRPSAAAAPGSAAASASGADGNLEEAPLTERAEAPRAKTSWLKRLTTGLSRTGQSISSLFVGVKVDENLFEELETALIMADAGVEATEQLLNALRARVRKERIGDAAEVKTALRDILAEHLKPLEKQFPIDRASPLVVMIAGVNGAGKTTSIGKLANAFQRQGKSVLLAAGDTFRAAAREQLVVWGERNNVSVISQDGGDPAAVAFDAVNAGRARRADIVMVDTAGRLPTQLHLMEELKKIKRVIGKADGDAPHEVLLVVDGNTGQNAISQIRAFDAAIELTGLVVTKLDGTAKGGTLAAVAAGSQGVRPVPVYWIGVGEGLEDLQPFVAREFATAVVGE